MSYSEEGFIQLHAFVHVPKYWPLGMAWNPMYHPFRFSKLYGGVEYVGIIADILSLTFWYSGMCV